MNDFNERIKLLLKDPRCDQELVQQIKEEGTFPPFSSEERLLAYLLYKGIMSFDEYHGIIEGCYADSKDNKYLDLYNMAPRTFGQTWGEKHIRSLSPEFVKATKANALSLYPAFDGEFDILVDNIRVEVKACRANRQKGADTLSSRAYSHYEARTESFKYHFQQIKVTCCDVFIWIGVCKDKLLYWVLSSEDVISTGKLGSQHRNRETGNEEDIYEGQVFMTEEELEPYRVDEKDILNVVRRKGEK